MAIGVLKFPIFGVPKFISRSTVHVTLSMNKASSIKATQQLVTHYSANQRNTQ